jgi:glutathione S-transferase
MLTLYHGDTAVCAAKVRLTLTEKQIPWESMPIDLSKGGQFDPEYMKLNPNAVVPTLIHDGQVLTESTVINEYLDDAFPQHPLRPADAMGRARVHWWTKREDTIHAGINTATTAIVFRPDLLTKTDAERAARIDSIPDPLRRAKFHELMETGLASHTFRDALVVFAKLFRDMEKALANGPWLVGREFTLADSGLASFFFRLEQLDLAGMWREHFPRVTDWYARISARPSFKKAIADYVPDRARANYAKHSEGTWKKVREPFVGVLREI